MQHDEKCDFGVDRLIKAVTKNFGFWRDKRDPLGTHWHRMGDFVAEDIFIAGYPKSGNTWMQLVVASIVYGFNPEQVPDTLVQELVPDVHYIDRFKRFRTPTSFKTHSVPRPEYRRCIHLVRDGRDVMCSYRAFLSTLRDQSVTIGGMLDSSTKVPFGMWHDHTRKWIENPFKADILVVKYEDLKTRGAETLMQVADFIGTPISLQRANEIADSTHVSKMKRREQTLGWDNQEWPEDANFVRRGISGGLRDELTEADQDLITQRFGDSLAHFGYL